MLIQHSCVKCKVHASHTPTSSSLHITDRCDLHGWSGEGGGRRGSVQKWWAVITRLCIQLELLTCQQPHIYPPAGRGIVKRIICKIEEKVCLCMYLFEPSIGPGFSPMSTSCFLSSSMEIWLRSSSSFFSAGLAPEPFLVSCLVLFLGGMVVVGVVLGGKPTPSCKLCKILACLCKV